MGFKKMLLTTSVLLASVSLSESAWAGCEFTEGTGTVTTPFSPLFPGRLSYRADDGATVTCASDIDEPPGFRYNHRLVSGFNNVTVIFEGGLQYSISLGDDSTLQNFRGLGEGAISKGNE